MFSFLIAWVKGGKTNTAMIAMLAVYALNKYFGVVTDETHIMETVAIILGALGQLHKAWKSETVQKIVAGLKTKVEEKQA